MLLAISWLAAASLVGLGALALAWPAPAAKFYGIPTDDPVALAYVRSTASRDVALGVTVGFACALGDKRFIASALLASAIVPLADFVLVSRARESGRALPLAIHATGWVGVLAVAAGWWWG